MRFFYLFLFLFGLISCGGGGTGPVFKDEGVGNTDRTGLEPTCGILQPEEVCLTFFFPTGTAEKREYTLNIPSSITEANPPLFILLHGGGGDAGSASIPFGIRKFIDDNKFIGVFPNARINSRGFRSWDFDDVQFIEEVIRQLRLNQKINPEKVYVFGYSNGSFLANLLACKIPDKITAMFGFAGTLLEPLTDCANTGSVAIHNMHAKGDDTIPYAGSPGNFLGALETIEEWRIFNQCDATFTTSTLFDLTKDIIGDDAETRTYENCLRTVALTSIEDSGHLPQFNLEELHRIMLNFYNQPEFWIRK
ncbi:MAG TPA: alpha/beta fold hydrolase [Aeromonadales bacterium]|nr:alpha/beta fold hydrolase [Aeromonadales bacterium]